MQRNCWSELRLSSDFKQTLKNKCNYLMEQSMETGLVFENLVYKIVFRILCIV